VTRQLARRHRRERVVGVGLGLVGLGVLVIAVIALRSPTGQDTTSGGSSAAGSTTPHSTPARPSSSASTPARPKTSASRPTRSSTAGTVRLPLVVLNNTTVTDLAQAAKARFEAGGWTVTSVGNMTNNIISTCAYYDPAQTGALAAARALQAQFPTIKRVVPKFPQLPPGPIVVVLTPDYS
jgi:LytR cell envelope-related transcriptional attenuator